PRGDRPVGYRASGRDRPADSSHTASSWPLASEATPRPNTILSSTPPRRPPHSLLRSGVPLVRALLPGRTLSARRDASRRRRRSAWAHQPGWLGPNAPDLWLARLWLPRLVARRAAHCLRRLPDGAASSRRSNRDTPSLRH